MIVQKVAVPQSVPQSDAATPEPRGASNQRSFDLRWKCLGLLLLLFLY